MNIHISTSDLIIELRKRMNDVCVCEVRTRLKEIEKLYMECKEKAEKPIPFSCIE